MLTDKKSTFPELPLRPDTFHFSSENARTKDHSPGTGNQLNDPISAQKPQTILVIDQDPDEADSVRNHLLPYSDEYSVLVANDLSAAKGIMVNHDIHLLITSWVTLNRWRTDFISSILGPSFAHANGALLLTTDGNSPIRVDSELTGCSIVDCISKPISRIELKSRVRFLLGLLGFASRLRMKMSPSPGPDKSMPGNLSVDAELSIYSENIRKKLGDGICKLYPYLNWEGKSKLNHILREFNVDPKAADVQHSEMAFDQLNDAFYSKLSELCPTITRNERRLCAFLCNERSPSEISFITGKTLNSINVAFSRVRTKLGQPDNKHLQQLLREISTNLDNTD